MFLDQIKTETHLRVRVCGGMCGSVWVCVNFNPTPIFFCVAPFPPFALENKWVKILPDIRQKENLCVCWGFY